MNYWNPYAVRTAALLLLVAPAMVLAQLGNVDQGASEKPALVILGTYHMAPTSSNVINLDVDDVTVGKRQRQLQDLVSRLVEFRPTKVMLECDFEDQKQYLARYRAYLSGNHKLQRNESEQIGFRLANAMDHAAVYCIDWGIFPDDPLYNYETYARNDPALDRFLTGLYAGDEQRAERRADEIASRTIIENLIAMNQPEALEELNARYYQILRISRDDEYVGANYVGWWHSRNLKILTNIIRFTESPDDRILVVYGSGHNKLLNQFARESGFYDVDSPLKYLQEY